MATYKVIQDIEAEDKFLGPLTLKQCIFAAIAIVTAYLTIVLLTKGIWIFAFPAFPVIIVSGFLAFPWGRDQPTETWLLAKIRFMFKPRKRVWDQSGMQELVKITAPPPTVQYTGNNLSQTEVKSRLKALADTIDTRGWAVKNSSMQPAMAAVTGSTDRLVSGTSLPAVDSLLTDNGADDIFDDTRSSQIDSQLSASSQSHRGQVVQQVQDALDPNTVDQTENFWFMNNPQVVSPGMASFGTQTAEAVQDPLLPDSFQNHHQKLDPEDQALLDHEKHEKQLRSQLGRNHKTIDPNGPAKPLTPVTPPSNPATIELARNDGLDVATIQRQGDNEEVNVPLR